MVLKDLEDFLPPILPSRLISFSHDHCQTKRGQASGSPAFCIFSRNSSHCIHSVYFHDSLLFMANDVFSNPWLVSKFYLTWKYLKIKCDLVFKKDIIQQAMLGCGINSGSGVLGTGRWEAVFSSSWWSLIPPVRGAVIFYRSHLSPPPPVSAARRFSFFRG